jgi:hypothetical protein
MGLYGYLEELWRKKQSDALRFLLRVRGWEYRFVLCSLLTSGETALLIHILQFAFC